jgi:ABC-2 type transport system ATP-binding protein
MPTPALSISNLTKSFSGKPVVKEISFAIEPGEIFGLLGPNGAGKSTTINMVTGVARVESGKIEVFGRDNQSDFVETRRLIGVMHQEIVVDTFFNVDTALKLHAGYYGVKDDPKWRALLIDRLALGPHLKKEMIKLSGGMKRRFMVAKAMIHKPKLLILDEPTAGVDVELRQQLWEFVREVNRDMGTTVLLTTHYLEEAEEMCGRVAIMNEGNIIAMDRTRDLLNKLDEKRLIVHLASPLSAVPTGLPGTLEGGGRKLVLRVEHGLGECLKALASLGAQVKELETQAPSLQEAFLKLTRRGSNRPDQSDGRKQ